MKKRIGFVSNSSSSSFILSAPKDEKLGKTEMTMIIDLEEFITDKITTLKELQEYYLEEMCYDKEEMEEDSEYKDCKKVIDEGDIIYMCQASTDGEPEEAYVCNCGLGTIRNKKVIIVRDSDGF